MKRVITTLVAMTALLLAVMAGTAAAGNGNGNGLSPDRLQDAGWGCFSIPLGIHCTQHLDAMESGDATAVPVMVFEHDTEDFLGTELLLHDDVFNQQPCPQDGGEYLDIAGPYWACHHYETSH